MFKEQNKRNSFSKTAKKEKKKNLPEQPYWSFRPLHRKHFPQKTIKVLKTKLDNQVRYNPMWSHRTSYVF